MLIRSPHNTVSERPSKNRIIASEIAIEYEAKKEALKKLKNK